MRIFVIAGLVTTILLSQVTLVEAVANGSREELPLATTECEPICAFSQQVVVAPTGLLVPTVVEYVLPDTWTSGQVAVYAETDIQFVPALVQTKTETVATPITVYADGRQALPALTDDRDDRLDTHYTFGVRPDMPGRAALTVRADEAVTVSAFKLTLSENVIPPRSVSVAVLNDMGEEMVVLAPVPVDSDGVVRFPVTTARDFFITFTHAQPLRISEVALYEKDPTIDRESTVRFLATPGSKYTLYLDPDRSVSVNTGEAPNLANDKDVRRLPLGTLTANPEYVPADLDRDGVLDVSDNCVSTPNTDQVDVDRNGTGDVCDDFDRDTYPNAEDNCVNEPNRDQADEDGDGIGDVCDDEESRFTEQNGWIPWVGMGMVLIVLIGLLALTVKR